MKRNKKNHQFWIYGKHCVTAALSNSNRAIERVLITKQNTLLMEKLEWKKFEVVDSNYIDDVVNDHRAVVQGIAVLVNQLKQPLLNDFLKCGSAQSIVLIIDQLSDPQNVGAIFRSATAFGAKAVITSVDNSVGETPGLLKSAAGAFELIPFIEVVNLAQAISILKEFGYWIIGLDGKSKDNIAEIRTDYDKIALVLGSEEKGMRYLTQKNCDIVTSIPISNDIESLNVSTAAAIALYELSGRSKISR